MSWEPQRRVVTGSRETPYSLEPFDRRTLWSLDLPVRRVLKYPSTGS